MPALLLNATSLSIKWFLELICNLRTKLLYGNEELHGFWVLYE